MAMVKGAYQTYLDGKNKPEEAKEAQVSAPVTAPV